MTECPSGHKAAYEREQNPDHQVEDDPDFRPGICNDKEREPGYQDCKNQSARQNTKQKRLTMRIPFELPAVRIGLPQRG